MQLFPHTETCQISRLAADLFRISRALSRRRRLAHAAIHGLLLSQPRRLIDHRPRSQTSMTQRRRRWKLKRRRLRLGSETCMVSGGRAHWQYTLIKQSTVAMPCYRAAASGMQPDRTESRSTDWRVFSAKFLFAWPTTCILVLDTNLLASLLLSCIIMSPLRRHNYIRLLHGKIGILGVFFGHSSVHRGRTHTVLKWNM